MNCVPVQGVNPTFKGRSNDGDHHYCILELIIWGTSVRLSHLPRLALFARVWCVLVICAGSRNVSWDWLQLLLLGWMNIDVKYLNHSQWCFIFLIFFFCPRYVPTIEDVDMYKSHKGPVTDLHIVDQYMMEVRYKNNQWLSDHLFQTTFSTITTANSNDLTVTLLSVLAALPSPNSHTTGVVTRSHHHVVITLQQPAGGPTYIWVGCRRDNSWTAGSAHTVSEGNLTPRCWQNSRRPTSGRTGLLCLPVSTNVFLMVSAAAFKNFTE